MGQGTLSRVSLISLSGASNKLFLNLLIQFYLNIVTGPLRLTSHSTTSCPTSIEQAADRPEAAAIGRLISASSENIPI